MTTGCDHPPHSSTTGWTCVSQVTIFHSSKSHNHRPTYPSCGYLAAEDAHLRCHTHSPITTAEKRGPTQVGFSGVAAPRISIIQSAPIVSQAVQSVHGHVLESAFKWSFIGFYFAEINSIWKLFGQNNPMI